MQSKTISIKTKINLFFQIAVFLFLFFFPLFLYAQGNISGLTYECVSNGVYGNCNYNDLILAVENVIDWVIIFTLQFAVVVIVYAGFNYMISGDNPSKRAQANEMLRKVAIGIFFVLAAWLVVTLIARELLTPEVIGVTPVRP